MIFSILKEKLVLSIIVTSYIISLFLEDIHDIKVFFSLNVKANAKYLH